MKALTVRQPWAHHIAQGLKTIEVRSWRTSYRGPLLITALAINGRLSLWSPPPEILQALG